MTRARNALLLFALLVCLGLAAPPCVEAYAVSPWAVRSGAGVCGLGHFLQPDPILDPGVSPYAYARNAPTEFSDPEGLLYVNANRLYDGNTQYTVEFEFKDRLERVKGAVVTILGRVPGIGPPIKVAKRAADTADDLAHRTYCRTVDPFKGTSVNLADFERRLFKKFVDTGVTDAVMGFSPDKSGTVLREGEMKVLQRAVDEVVTDMVSGKEVTADQGARIRAAYDIGATAERAKAGKEGRP